MRRGVAVGVLAALLLVSASLLVRAPHALLATGSCHCGFCNGTPSATCCARRCSSGCGGDHCSAPVTPTPSPPPTVTPTPIPHTVSPSPSPSPSPSASPSASPTPGVPGTVSGPVYVPPQPPGLFPPITPIALTPPTPTPKTTIYGHEDIVLDLDIHPIQVVQDPPHEKPKEEVPLVEDKATMVRVFVLLPKSMKGLKKATCTLTWGAETEKYVITADVFQTKGHVWVVPVEPPSPDPESPTTAQRVTKFLQSGGDKDVPESEYPSFLKKDYFWAYNFTFGGKGKPCPKQLTLNAKLVANGALLAERTEESTKEFKITQLTNKGGVFNVVVAGYASGRIPQDFIDPSLRKTKGIQLDTKTVQTSDFFEKLIAQKAEQYRHELLAVFPVAETALQMTVKTILFSTPGTIRGLAYADTYAGPASISTAIENMFPSADTILLVTNPGESNVTEDQFETGGEIGYCNCAGWTPFFSKSIHYVTVKTLSSALVAAHETGHDSRFFGKGHTSGGSVEDGWDAGGNISLDTTRGRDRLMLKVQEHPWILVEEYRSLLKELCASSDPVLLRVKGILEPDGKLDLAPPTLITGSVGAPGEGAGSLVFADGTGKTLATWPVPLQEEKSRRGFAVDAPLPEKARAVTLKLPGDVRRRFPISAHAPRFEWVDVQATPDGAALRVKYRASHPERLPVDIHFVYSPDGTRRIDLETPKGAPLSAEILLDIHDLPGGPKARLTAWASAGLRLTESVSFPFSVPDRKPRLWVDEEPGLEGAERFTTTLYDPEDGFGLRPVWSAEDGAPLGVGRHPDAKRLAALPTGRHRLTATVRDSAGNVAAASLDTEIAAPVSRTKKR